MTKDQEARAYVWVYLSNWDGEKNPIHLLQLPFLLSPPDVSFTVPTLTVILVIMEGKEAHTSHGLSQACQQSQASPVNATSICHDTQAEDWVFIMSLRLIPLDAFREVVSKVLSC